LSALAAALLGIPWKKIGLWFVKAKVWLLLVLKPLGAWGLAGMAIADATFIPMPFLDPLIVSYGVSDHAKVVIYCLAAAVGSAIGSLVPYFLGRAGGELVLLKRIDRARYERLRDRFASREFLAIMLPAMCPPPMPMKLFMLAAGVFEMRAMRFFLAIVLGKFLRFLIESVLVIVYGPAVLTVVLKAFHTHLALVLGLVGLVGVGVAVWVLRRRFAVRARTRRTETDKNRTEG
jgi:membrane protein YqaA with SNARE-associated domain